MCFLRLVQRLTVRCVVAAAYINLPNAVFCLLLYITPASFNPKFLKSRTHELLSPPESPIAQLHVVESFSRSSLYISIELIATKRTNALMIMPASSKSHQKRMDGEMLIEKTICPVVRSLVCSRSVYRNLLDATLTCVSNFFVLNSKNEVTGSPWLARSNIKQEVIKCLVVWELRYHYFGWVQCYDKRHGRGWNVCCVTKRWGWTIDGERVGLPLRKRSISWFYGGVYKMCSCLLGFNHNSNIDQYWHISKKLHK
jgi:hypothetical protein